MRTLWRDDISSFEGEFVRFREMRSYPKPVRDRQVPVVLGGNSDAALDRVVAYGDGWYGFNLSMDEVRERMEALSSRCTRAVRDRTTLEIAVSLRNGSPGDAAELAGLGVAELVVVEAPPDDPGQVSAWVASLARRWGVAP